MLSESRRRDEPACLLLVDVDEFKGINDHHGHAVGDDVLCRVAGILRQVVGGHGHVGRIGGDEFGIVLRSDESVAMQLGQRICEGVAGARFEGSDDLRCTVSCGVAQLGRSIDSLRDWMIAADVALYRAKNGGRGRACASDVSMRA
ncbi:MAG: GGDEF domain-containing protein [Xanthomonadales bacterium]|nr:GGDEF domain-containing protein [Xanthomonadales bacterium]